MAPWIKSTLYCPILKVWIRGLSSGCKLLSHYHSSNQMIKVGMFVSYPTSNEHCTIKSIWWQTLNGEHEPRNKIINVYATLKLHGSDFYLIEDGYNMFRLYFDCFHIWLCIWLFVGDVWFLFLSSLIRIIVELLTPFFRSFINKYRYETQIK